MIKNNKNVHGSIHSMNEVGSELGIEQGMFLSAVGRCFKWTEVKKRQMRSVLVFSEHFRIEI